MQQTIIGASAAKKTVTINKKLDIHLLRQVCAYKEVGKPSRSTVWENPLVGKQNCLKATHTAICTDLYMQVKKLQSVNKKCQLTELIY